jgi:hypothetical protein
VSGFHSVVEGRRGKRFRGLRGRSWDLFDDQFTSYRLEGHRCLAIYSLLLLLVVVDA